MTPEQVAILCLCVGLLATSIGVITESRKLQKQMQKMYVELHDKINRKLSDDYIEWADDNLQRKDKFP